MTPAPRTPTHRGQAALTFIAVDIDMATAHTRPRRAAADIDKAAAHKAMPVAVDRDRMAAHTRPQQAGMAADTVAARKALLAVVDSAAAPASIARRHSRWAKHARPYYRYSECPAPGAGPPG